MHMCTCFCRLYVCGCDCMCLCECECVCTQTLKCTRMRIGERDTDTDTDNFIREWVSKKERKSKRLWESLCVEPHKEFKNEFLMFEFLVLCFTVINIPNIVPLTWESPRFFLKLSLVPIETHTYKMCVHTLRSQCALKDLCLASLTLLQSHFMWAERKTGLDN